MNLPSYATNAVRSLGLKEGEFFQMMCDETMYEAGLNVCAAARAVGATATILVWPEVARPQDRDPEPVLASLEKLDAVLLWLGVIHPSEMPHRFALRFAAERTGTRLAFGGYMDESILMNEMAADYAAIEQRCLAFEEALEGSRSIHVSGAGGTDLTLSVAGRKWIRDDGRLDEPGRFGNLPAGEVFIAPLEDSAEGVLVVDRSIASVGAPGLVDEPVRITFQKGRVVDVAGGEAADAFRELIKVPGGDVIAELGIGTNELARMQGNVMTDEKVLGSAHIAVGSNVGAYGGVNESAIHCDGCFADATIEADGRVVIQKGELVP
jgi:leucyl aminopeptidase (aminopeptidase T)